MLICPVCRSQNMDTAKFCGNCGNSFQRQADPTSSLIQCAQGHIYSAVYEHCPYCPQAEQNDASNFITRVESEPITTLESPNQANVAAQAPPYDFSTRIDFEEKVNDTLFESNQPAAAIPPPAPAQPTTLAPTEVISTIPAFETMVESAVSSTTATAPETEAPASVNANRNTATRFESTANSATTLEQIPAPSPSPPPMSPSPRTGQAPEIVPRDEKTIENERHTIVVADQEVRGVKGKIVGWLITYHKNPDGDDFRVYSGYNRIGANPVCDIVIDDETVSGSHAIIVYREGRCLIKDDLSRNGTFVNGREITEAHPLQNYDQIRVGNTSLTFISAQRLS